MNLTALAVAAWILLSYLLGSVPFGLLASLSV